MKVCACVSTRVARTCDKRWNRSAVISFCHQRIGLSHILLRSPIKGCVRSVLRSAKSPRASASTSGNPAKTVRRNCGASAWSRPPMADPGRMLVDRGILGHPVLRVSRRGARASGETRKRDSVKSRWGISLAVGRAGLPGLLPPRPQHTACDDLIRTPAEGSDQSADARRCAMLKSRPKPETLQPALWRWRRVGVLQCIRGDDPPDLHQDQSCFRRCAVRMRMRRSGPQGSPSPKVARQIARISSSDKTRSRGRSRAAFLIPAPMFSGRWPRYHAQRLKATSADLTLFAAPKRPSTAFASIAACRSARVIDSAGAAR